MSINIWHRVEEIKPDNGTNVLIWKEGFTEPVPSHYAGGLFYRYIANKAEGDRLILYWYDDVTHWQTLPLIPHNADSNT